MLGFTPLMPFITQPQDFHTAEAAKGMAANRSAQYTHEDRQAELGEQKREFNEKLPLEQFRTFMPQYNANRVNDETEREHDTELLRWIHNVVQTDPRAAEKSAPFLHGILQSRGIDMQWDPQTGEPAAPGQAPPPTTPAPIQTEVEKLQEEPVAPATAPGMPKNEDEALSELEAAQRASAEKDRQDSLPGKQQPAASMDPGIEMKGPMADRAAQTRDPGIEMTGPIAERAAQVQDPGMVMESLPGENFAAYMTRLGGQIPKPAPAPQAAAPMSPPPEAAPAQAPAPQAGEPAPHDVKRGRWVFSKNGKELGSINIGDVASFQDERAGALAAGYASDVKPEADKAFVEGMTKRLVSAGVPPDKVAGVIHDIIQPELDRRSKERSSFALARSKAQSGPSLSGISTVNDDIMNVQREFAQRYGVGKLRDRADAAANAIEMLDSTDPVAQRDAFTAHLKAMFSSVTSDRELGFAAEAAGKLEQIKMKFNSYFSNGELPPGYKILLAEANRIIGEQVQKRLNFVGDQASQYIMRTPALSLDANGRKQAAGVVRGYFSGNFEDTPELGGPMGVPGMGGGSGKGSSSESRKGSPAAPEMSRPTIPEGADKTIRDLLRKAQ